MKKSSIAIISVFLGALFCVTQSYGLVMGPARFEVSLPPGEVAEGDYYVQNDTDQNAHIVVEPENWFKEAYDYGKLGIKDWVEFDTYEFDLKPKEIKKLRLRIKVPVNVKGELVSQIFFTSTVLKENGKPAEGIKARIGAVLYVAIKGTEIVDAGISSVDILKYKDKGNENLKIEINVKNKGNVHIKPTGKVTIEDAAGQKITEMELSAGKPVLPMQETEYSALWENPKIEKGAYRALIVINYGKELNMEKAITSEKSFEVSEGGKVIVK